MSSNNAIENQGAPVQIARRGLLYILSSPSGAGKTTLARQLLAADADIAMSVSITTRRPRPGEREGVDYHFTDAAGFDAMREAGELLEWARVFDHFYGTPKTAVMTAIADGRDVLFDIDWQGAQQLSEKMPGDVVRVFVLPPSGATLEHRLHTRAQDPPDVVARRMAAASAELSHWPEYDYVIVNSDIGASVTAAKAILAAERLRRSRLVGLSAFVRDMQDAL